MKSKKLKIVTLLLIILTSIIIFKLHSFGSEINTTISYKLFYDTSEENNINKLVDNKIILAFANNSIYNLDGVPRTEYYIKNYDNNKTWSITIYIDDNEEPFKKIVMTDEEFWSFENARIEYKVGCQNYKNVEVYNKEFEINFNNIDIKNSIIICYKEGKYLDGENKNLIRKICIPCHTENSEIIIDGYKKYLNDEYI